MVSSFPALIEITENTGQLGPGAVKNINYKFTSVPMMESEIDLVFKIISIVSEAFAEGKSSEKWTVI